MNAGIMKLTAIVEPAIRRLERSEYSGDSTTMLRIASPEDLKKAASAPSTVDQRDRLVCCENVFAEASVTPWRAAPE